MFSVISYKIVNSLERENIIKSEEMELYRIGYLCIFSFLSHLLIVMLTGVLLKQFFESTIFILFFYLLRICAGGLHLKNASTCFVFSIFLEIVSNLAIKYLFINTFGTILIISIMLVVIFCFCPVSNRAAVYTLKEKRFRYTLSIIIYLIELIIFSAFLLLELVSFQNAIVYAWLLFLLLNIMGQLQNKLLSIRPKIISKTR